MESENPESKSSSVLVAVLIVVGLLVVGAGVALVLGGITFFYAFEAHSDFKQAMTDVNEAMHPVVDEEPEQVPARSVELAKPTEDEILIAAKKIVLATLPVAADVAWSVPVITELNDGWYRVTGALTVEGKSSRWTCEVLPIERDSARAWDQRQLVIEE